jgi:hypothetical protein
VLLVISLKGKKKVFRLIFRSFHKVSNQNSCWILKLLTPKNAQSLRLRNFIVAVAEFKAVKHRFNHKFC